MPKPQNSTSLSGALTTLHRGLMPFVMLAGVTLIFVESVWLTLVANLALVVFLAMGWRRFSVGTWVPVLLSLATFALALWKGVSTEVLLDALGRMLFLAALISMMGTLRSAAALAPEVIQAGTYLTGQPASRRYIALTFGGHLFGVLINFGGLALLLDMATRSMKSEASLNLPAAIREVKLKRMTLAIVRGFGLISLWSPLGFSANVILITLPGLTYLDFGPVGFVMSFVFIAIGWSFDQVERRRIGTVAVARPKPPAGSWLGAVMLVGHVLALGLLIFVVHGIFPLSFQEGLMTLIPTYAFFWVIWSTRSAPWAGLREAGKIVMQRLPNSAGEVGVFASAGFLSVMLLALIPVESLRLIIADFGLGAISLALCIVFGIVLMAFLGINPIVSASVLGAIASQLAVPGLSDAAIAFSIMGGWTTVIGLSPFITTIIFCAAIIERPPILIGLKWNRAYSITILTLWCAFLITLMLTGVV